MPDFTLHTFHQLVTALKNQHYTFQTFADFLKNPATHTIILRHDVDARKMNSLKTAQLENELEIAGTYYFRMVPESFDEEVIKQIAGLGHEIGYHYEDLSRCAAAGFKEAPLPGGAGGGFYKWLKGLKAQRYKGLSDVDLLKLSIESFKENLARLRRVVPVETICMHGSPLSRYDNRKLWEKYDYRDYGIIGEPYFDIDFNQILYLTDTGRRWDGEAVSVRDKAVGSWRSAKGRKGLRDEEIKRRRDEETKRRRDEETKCEKIEHGTSDMEQGTRNLKLETINENRKSINSNRTPHAASRKPVYSFHSTFDIIRACESGILPDQLMITLHPQRWYNEPIPWVRELVWQNLKNAGKWIIVTRNQGIGN